MAQVRAEAGQPPLMWIPIPLDGGKQGWAQLQIQEGESRTAKAGRASHQIRLWWDTPALGQVQVTLDASGEQSLTALFTVLTAAVNARVKQELPKLQDRLATTGFDSIQVSSRQALPGESISPVVPRESTSRLDRRM